MFELDNGRILAEMVKNIVVVLSRLKTGRGLLVHIDVVADFSRGHRCSHFLGRPCDSVAAEVYLVHRVGQTRTLADPSPTPRVRRTADVTSVNSMQEVRGECHMFGVVLSPLQPSATAPCVSRLAFF